MQPDRDCRNLVCIIESRSSALGKRHAQTFDFDEDGAALFKGVKQLGSGCAMQFMPRAFIVSDRAARYLRMLGKVRLRPIEHAAGSAAERRRENR